MAGRFAVPSKESSLDFFLRRRLVSVLSQLGASKRGQAT
jgi:hypothetical protein